MAIISLLMLRGPQTPGELNTNSGRTHEFESIEEVQETLERLSTSEPAYVLQLPRKAGQKEARYAHLLSGIPEVTDDDDDDITVRSSGGLEARVAKLEHELAELKEAFDKLMKELM